MSACGVQGGDLRRIHDVLEVVLRETCSARVLWMAERHAILDQPDGRLLL